MSADVSANINIANGRPAGVAGALSKIYYSPQGKLWRRCSKYMFQLINHSINIWYFKSFKRSFL